MAAVLLGGCTSGGGRSQTRFGADMARRGLWREAAFRWEKAAKADPQSFKVHNNLGVAYESNGDYKRALEHYKRALELSRNNTFVQRNYARFVEFYKSYAAKEGPDETVAPAALDAAPEGEKKK